MLDTKHTNRILQIGAGGVGGPLAQHLSLIAREQLFLMDGDSFEEKNLTRQPLAQNNLGANKAMAVAGTLYNTTAIPAFLEKENVEEVLDEVKPTMLVLAVDNDAPRKLVFALNDKLPILWAANEIWDPQAGLTTPGWKWNPMSYFAKAEGNDDGCGIQTIHANLAAAGMATSLLQLHLAPQENKARKSGDIPLFIAQVEGGQWQLKAKEL